MAKKKSSGKKLFKTEKEMDEFLENEDLGELFKKFGSVKKPKIKKVNIDLPEWLIAQLDLEATRAGVSRQPLIKLWLIQKLDEERKKRSA
jgi:predicted DNA binding CopG/RHH family protein